MKNTALITAGIVFLLVGILHAVRYLKGWTIIITNQPISLEVSIYGGVIAIVLAIWMFVAASK
ncbi:MAG: hypothetical protein JSS07_09150 [Proteobacteria bacterium]|nr:hypothetical protein [Pseudomonadota bacterium]